MTSEGAAKIPRPEEEAAEEETKTRVDVDVRYSMVPEWILDHEQSGLSANAVRLYAVLARYGNSEGGAIFPSRRTLAARMGVSKLETVDRAGRELRAGKALFVKSGAATGRPNTYILAFSPPTPFNGVPPSTGYPHEQGTGVSRSTGYDRKNSTDRSSTAYAVERVRTAWTEHAPPLINHRSTFFESKKVATAVAATVKVYPVDTVVEAIGLYATTLGSDDFTWSYSWTLLDFLKRGIDRFVPEADPLTNFARRTAPVGRDRGVTFGDLLKMGGTDDDAGASAAHQIDRVAQG